MNKFKFSCLFFVVLTILIVCLMFQRQYPEFYELHFEPGGFVSVNGERFDLKNKRTGWEIRRRYRCDEYILIGIENASMKDIEAVHDCKVSDASVQIPYVRFSIQYEKGRKTHVFFYPREGDGFAEDAVTRRTLSVDAEDSSVRFSREMVSNSCLEVRVDFQWTTGARLLELIKNYKAMSGECDKVYIPVHRE